MDSDDTILLESNDGKRFTEPLHIVISCSATIADLKRDAKDSDSIVLKDIDSPTLEAVLEFCKTLHGKRVDLGPSLSKEETMYFKGKSKTLVYSILLASNYLAAHDLIDLCARYMAWQMATAGKSTDAEERAYQFFALPDVQSKRFSDDEIEAVCQRSPWIRLGGGGGGGLKL